MIFRKLYLEQSHLQETKTSTQIEQMMALQYRTRNSFDLPDVTLTLLTRQAMSRTSENLLASIVG